MAHLILRLLRVFVRPDGSLAFNHREGAYRPTSEDWWRDVLGDRRVSLPVHRDIDERSADVAYRLDRQPGDKIYVTCACNHTVLPMDKAMLVRELGPATNVVWAIRMLAGCRNRNKMGNSCRAMPLK